MRIQVATPARAWRVVSLWRVAAVAVLLFAVLPEASGAAGKRRAGDDRPAKPPLSIVALQPGVDPAQAARDLGVRPTFVYRHVLNGFAAALPASAARVARSRQVRAIGPDPVVRISGQRLSTGVRRIAADTSPLAQIDGRDGPPIDADVAILDTGVSGRSDLDVVGGTNVFATSGDVKNCDASDGDTTDPNGHGTSVAGIIGAVDNTAGVVGVAPGVRLWAVTVLDRKGTGTWSSVICGLDWVAAHRDTIDIVNLSFGGQGVDSDCRTTPPSNLHTVICALVNDDDIAVVVAAGNQRDDAANYAPAAYDEAITVGALADADGRPGGRGGKTCDGSHDDALAKFSNFGPDVDIVAPGSCIVSLGLGKKGRSRYSGTSQAAPHVAGAIALFLDSVDPRPGTRVAAARAWLATTASQPMDAAQKRRRGARPLAAPALYLGGT